MIKKFSPIRLHDIGPGVTTYLDVKKKVFSNSKNRSPTPPPISEKTAKQITNFLKCHLLLFKVLIFLYSRSKLMEAYEG
jgi:hypothetical protein